MCLCMGATSLRVWKLGPKSSTAWLCMSSRVLVGDPRVRGLGRSASRQSMYVSCLLVLLALLLALLALLVVLLVVLVALMLAPVLVVILLASERE